MSPPVVLVVGGAGFIGCNLAAHLARMKHRIRIFDDLSRPGVDRNLAWLQRTFGDRIEARIGDIRDRPRLREAVDGADVVFHFAAQTAVTTSMVEPRHDFDVNARGTIEVLEAVRHGGARTPLIFTSTNKVYGCLPDLPLREDQSRWVPIDTKLAYNGIDETRPLQFRTPYGCSKGCADQYVLDYAHSFGIPAAVFRMSCIYGPHQFGTEDQGWVAHFLIRAIEGKPITIYGDGKQVRDVLFVDDLVDAFVRAWSRIGAISGRAFNIGGGPENTISLRELVAMIETLRGMPPTVRFEGWREGDQKFYISNTTAFAQATGWRPRVGPRAGVEALHGWLTDQRAPALEGARHA
ncbi:MAG: NAD-dependent epimerase/dehydratase family protein [Kofleriaceae bacterium]|nr:NAD-dependent epimerase/dehydratase family protein [Kofleriaceae bacterium]